MLQRRQRLRVSGLSAYGGARDGVRSRSKAGCDPIETWAGCRRMRRDLPRERQRRRPWRTVLDCEL